MDSFLTILNATAENLFLYVFMFIVSLAIVITVHELGHYWMARLFGVRIDEFAFGFGKELFGFGGKKEGQTRWSYCLLPIGGYVKIFGDVAPQKPELWDKEKQKVRPLTPEELEVAYCTKPLWQRALIVGAGPAINIILTLALFIATFTIIGQKSSFPVINTIALDTAADRAGIKIGDKITHMDGQPLRRLDDIYDKTWYEDPPEPHTYTIIRDGKELEITYSAFAVEYANTKGILNKHGQTGMVQLGPVKLKDIAEINGQSFKDNTDKAREYIKNHYDEVVTIYLPYKDSEGEKENKSLFRLIFPESSNTHLNDPSHEKYMYAFVNPPENYFYLKLGVYEALSRATFMMKEGVLNSYKMIKAVAVGTSNDRVLAGVAKVSEKTANAAKTGVYEYLIFLAILSFMIGFINLLPIPVFDGGHLAFLAWEAVTGNPVSPRIQSILIIIGLVFLLGIMIIANVGDLIALINGDD